MLIASESGKKLTNNEQQVTWWARLPLHILQGHSCSTGNQHPGSSKQLRLMELLLVRTITITSFSIDHVQQS